MNNKNFFSSMKKSITKYKKEILGGALLVGGSILVWFSKKIILNMVLFLGGAILIYMGLKLLNVNFITKFVDNQLNRLTRR